jgi:homoserine O-acetyltransferase
VLVVADRGDHMVNPTPAFEFAVLLAAEKLDLESDCGHRAPGCEASMLHPRVRAFLDR